AERHVPSNQQPAVPLSLPHLDVGGRDRSLGWLSRPDFATYARLHRPGGELAIRSSALSVCIDGRGADRTRTGLLALRAASAYLVQLSPAAGEVHVHHGPRFKRALGNASSSQPRIRAF